jgi:hypothetical protein
MYSHEKKRRVRCDDDVTRLSVCTNTKQDWLLLGDLLFKGNGISTITVITYLSMRELATWAQVCQYAVRYQQMRLKQFLDITNNGTIILPHLPWWSCDTISSSSSSSSLVQTSSSTTLSSWTMSPIMLNHIQHCLSNNVTFQQILRQREWKESETDTEFTTSTSSGTASGWSPVELSRLSIANDYSILIEPVPAPDKLWVQIYDIELCRAINKENNLLSKDDAVNEHLGIYSMTSSYAIAFIEMFKAKCTEFFKHNISKVIELWENMSTWIYKDFNVIIGCDDLRVLLCLDFDFDNWKQDLYLNFLCDITQLDLIGLLQCLFPKDMSNVVFPKHRSIGMSTPVMETKK